MCIDERRHVSTKVLDEQGHSVEKAMIEVNSVFKGLGLMADILSKEACHPRETIHCMVLQD